MEALVPASLADHLDQTWGDHLLDNLRWIFGMPFFPDTGICLFGPVIGSVLQVNPFFQKRQW